MKTLPEQVNARLAAPLVVAAFMVVLGPRNALQRSGEC